MENKIQELSEELERCKEKKIKVEATGYKLILFWFVIGFILGAVIF